MVVAIDEIALQVQHVGQPAGEAGAEVLPGAAQHRDHAAGHVLAAMVAGAFHHRGGAGVAHAEALAGAARAVELAARGAVEAGVAHDRRVARDVARGDRRVQHQLAAGHALADVIVGIALEHELEAAGIPGPEALPGVAGEAHRDRRRGHAMVAVRARDRARHARADAAVAVGDGVVVLAARLRRDRRRKIGEHARGQRTRIARRVARHAAGLRLRAHQPGGGKDRGEVEPALLGGRALGLAQQVGAADQVLEPAHAQARQVAAHVLGHEAEIVDHHLRQPGEVRIAQARVLGRDAGGAVVEVADAQVLAAQRHHRAGAEAEALGAQDRALDHVQPGLEPAVDLQAHLVAQRVHAQGLLGLREAQLPRRAGVLDRALRRGAGAAVVAGNGDEVGVGLDHARRHRAHAGVAHELDRHQRGRIDLLQVIHQLRQVLDRIDVVVRRR